MNNIKLINDDCMNVMKTHENNYFDLAIVDPPYGIKASKDMSSKVGRRSNGTIWKRSRKEHKKKDWDNTIPNNKYFKELFRVSKNQIIWGGNYFHLQPTRGIICWDKKQRMETFSAFEMAWTSFNCVARLFEYDNKGFMCKDGAKIHPTQKPIKLYEWLLKNYSKKEHKILDTHLGSGSSAIASYYFGVKEFVGIELDKEYFEKMSKRFKEQTKQIKLF